MKSIFFLLILTTHALGAPESICGEDERRPSHETAIGRMKLPGIDSGCTVTMIGPSCAITAGHCVKYMVSVEFNVPTSIKGIPVLARPHDTFKVDQTSVIFVRRPGEDWAVIKLLPNAKTKKLPGNVYGYYPVSLSDPEPGTLISISGYGSDLKNTGELNYTLQTHEGELKSIRSLLQGQVLSYFIDTVGGNSGSAIIRVKEQDIIGIHTHGGCNPIANHGTSISQKPDLMKAIQSCLASEK